MEQGTSGASDSSGTPIDMQQFDSILQRNNQMRQERQEESNQKEEEQSQQQQEMQGWDQEQKHLPDGNSNQQEHHEQGLQEQLEQSQLQLNEHVEHTQLEPPQPRQEQFQQQPQQQQLQPQQQHLQQSFQTQQHHLPQVPQPQQQQLQQPQQQQPHQQLQQPQQQQHLNQILQPQKQLPQQSQQQHIQQMQQLPAPVLSQQQQLNQGAQFQQHSQPSQLPSQRLQQPQQQQLQPQQQHFQQSFQTQQHHLPQIPQPQQQLQQPQEQHLNQIPQPQQQLPQQSQQQHMQQMQQSPSPVLPQQHPQQPLRQSSLSSQQQHLQQSQQPHLQQLLQSQQQSQQQLQQQVQQQQQQQASQSAVGQGTSSTKGSNASISFGSLIPIILPHISKEQAQRLQTLYSTLRRNEVTKEDFLRTTRNIVGDQMLVHAVRQMQKQQVQSQSGQSSQPNQQQQQQQQQNHSQGGSQQLSQPSQQSTPLQLQQQTQRASDHQPLSQTSAPTCLSNSLQHSRQVGEQQSEFSSAHLNQTSTINLHQVKHEVDRNVVGFSSSSQQQQHLQLPQSTFPMYGRAPGSYSSHSFSLSPGIPQSSGVKGPIQDSQTRQVIHAQGGVQAQGGSAQLSTIKTTKYDLSKLSKRREDEERQKMPQSGGTSHFPGQHQPGVWGTVLDKEQTPSVFMKQESNDIIDQHTFQAIQPITDNHGQSVLQKPEGVEHQIIKTSSISSANISTAPLSTSTTTLHHTMSSFGASIPGSHSSLNPLQGQVRVQLPSTPPSSAVVSQIKTPSKKPLIGQKKPFDLTGPSAQIPSKKQKVSGGFLDQSIDQLNDVTAVSGVNLREEEEQLFAGPKEESRATEALRRVVQEEEDRTFLQRGPLRTKLAAIMVKYGIKYVSSDSERCLSLCVEERLRTMLGQLIRLSKQRVDLERFSHKVAITSDVRRQIVEMNKKAKEDLEKKQAEEAEKLRKLNETENNTSLEVEKDEARSKAQRAQKEEDDKMRANAANVAARAAVGGDDMLSKWQLMAEQARQKREGTSDGASGTRTNRDANRKSLFGGSKASSISDHQDVSSTGTMRNMGRTTGPTSQTKPVHNICVKDVIAFLEREPQMTKSTLLYRLYERDAVLKVSENQNNENSS